MVTKARIQNGTVAEILTADPFPPFHESIIWVECNDEVVEGDLYKGSIFSHPPPIPAVVPQQVSMAQAQAALYRGGYLDQVNAAVDAAVSAGDVETGIFWHKANTVDRGSQFVAKLAAELGLTAAQIDSLFILAASIS